MSNKSTPLHGRLRKDVLEVNYGSTNTPDLRKKIISAQPRFFRSANSTPTTRCTTPSNKGAQKSTNVIKLKKQINDASADDNNTEISTSDQDQDVRITVAVRVRPLNAQECSRAHVRNTIRNNEKNELTVLAGSTADCAAGLTYSFAYDHVFYSCDPKSKDYASQADLFEHTAQPLIERAFEGYNACLFAYGQTGSGKSYSMMGIEALDDGALDGYAPHSEAGIIPRFCYELFRRLKSVKNRIQAEIEVSYFEIYNEKIHDLLSVTQAINGGTTPMQRTALKVREHPIWGPYVVNLSVHSVDSYEALRNWLAVGNSQRATAATGMNDKSSRSHSIFNIVLNLTDLNHDEKSNLSYSNTEANVTRQTRRSKICLVDLAGSERISTLDSNCDRIREGVSINKSLMTLGKVIAALSNNCKKHNGSAVNFVPYRESVLTWLLRENLGGNSKTVMLATVSPASIQIDETLATLRYACQARTIVNRVKVNESPHDKIIRELKAEVDRLKSLQNEYERQRRLSANSNPIPRKIIIETSVNENEVEALRQQLLECEKDLKRAEKSWMERLNEAEDQRKSEMLLLKRKGLAMELSVQQKQACLVNLTADPILSGTLFYVLPPGIVKIGRTRTSIYCSQPDILLDGPLVAYHHCIIENKNRRLYLTPENEDFETYLNGELVHNKQEMFHGDRLVIGGSHYFRISNSFCSKRENNAIIDFQLAHKEILHKQEKNLRRELEEEKRAALKLIELERIENERNFKQRQQKFELEQFTFKCDKEILETERKVLHEETTNAHSKITEAIVTPSFKSTLLDDINRIMQNPSEECLHKTQLMVKEATQICRSLDIKLEFRQSQILDEFGMFRAAVVIIDRENLQKAEWPTARLEVWLEIIRDVENPNAHNIFNSVDIEWEPIDADTNDTLNSSKISLNLSMLKDKLKKQFSGSKSNSPASCTSRSHTFIKKKLTFDDIGESPCSPKHLNNSIQRIDETSFPVLAERHIHDMLRSAVRLKKICQSSYSNNQENIPNYKNTQIVFRDSLERIENILQGMRSISQNILANDAEERSPLKTPKSVQFLID